jgi:competence protein ComEA
VDGRPLDLNSAPVDALTRLPGVGPVLAARIADARPYASVDDLRRVRGVGRAKLERFRELVTIAER